MALITFGVPVYNGADQIEECLNCLCNQTLRDIEIIVSDNASTDGTAEIVAEYASRDSRVRLVRQSSNVGLMNNFKAVLENATSPWFILRCHDDLSSLNYAEALYDAVLANPDAPLAVPVVNTIRAGKPPRTTTLPTCDHASKLLNIRNLLFQSHAGWFCGLWHVETFRPVFDKVWSRYNSPWGSDHLAMYPFLVSQRVALVPEAVFIQRITPKAHGAGYKKPSLRSMMQLRRIFLNVCREFRGELGISGVRGAVIAAMTWFYTGKRVFKFRNIFRYTLLGRW